MRPGRYPAHTNRPTMRPGRYPAHTNSPTMRPGRYPAHTSDPRRDPAVGPPSPRRHRRPRGRRLRRHRPHQERPRRRRRSRRSGRRSRTRSSILGPGNRLTATFPCPMIIMAGLRRPPVHDGCFPGRERCVNLRRPITQRAQRCASLRRSITRTAQGCVNLRRPITRTARGPLARPGPGAVSTNLRRAGRVTAAGSHASRLGVSGASPDDGNSTHLTPPCARIVVTPPAASTETVNVCAIRRIHDRQRTHRRPADS
jgi:hypothetical protein